MQHINLDGNIPTEYREMQCIPQYKLTVLLWFACHGDLTSYYDWSSGLTLIH